MSTSTCKLTATPGSLSASPLSKQEGLRSGGWPTVTQGAPSGPTEGWRAEAAPGSGSPNPTQPALPLSNPLGTLESNTRSSDKNTINA